MAETDTAIEKEETTTKKKKSVSEWVGEHPKAVFWIRFALWAILACVLPFAFIVWRFDLFQTISKTQIGGWGIIAIVLLAVFVFSVIRYVRMAMSASYSLTTQCLNGFCKVVLPCLALLVIVYCMKNDVELMIQVLGCVTLCEAMAVPVNPLPKWAYDRQKDVRVEERKETMDYLLSEFFKKKGEEEGK